MSIAEAALRRREIIAAARRANARKLHYLDSYRATLKALGREA